MNVEISPIEKYFASVVCPTIAAQVPACAGGQLASSNSLEGFLLVFEEGTSKADIAKAYEIANAEMTDAKLMSWQKEQAKAEADELAAERIRKAELAAKVALDAKRNEAHSAIDRATTKQEIETAKKLASRTQLVRER